MADDLKHVNLTSPQIRALAHALRSRLLGELRINGPATATRLAEVLGTNTGATSYHLRQLAEVGLVVEDPEAGHGRQRVWRAAHESSGWDRDTFAGDPDAQAASDWIFSYMARNLAERIEDWTRAAPGEPQEWRDAASYNDYILRLDAGQLTRMIAELTAVVERWRTETTEKPSDDARNVLMYLYPVPLPQKEEE